MVHDGELVDCGRNSLLLLLIQLLCVVCVVSVSHFHNLPVSSVFWASRLLHVISATSSSCSARSTLSFVCTNWYLGVVCGRVAVHVEWLASSFLSWNHLELWRCFFALSPPCTSSQVHNNDYAHLQPPLFRRKMSTTLICCLTQEWSTVECFAFRLFSLILKISRAFGLSVHWSIFPLTVARMNYFEDNVRSHRRHCR